MLDWTGLAEAMQCMYIELGMYVDSSIVHMYLHTPNSECGELKNAFLQGGQLSSDPYMYTEVTTIAQHEVFTAH